MNTIQDPKSPSIDMDKKGDLFIALIGDKFDGHNYLENAISKGACGVLVSNIILAKKYNGLFVNDTKEALLRSKEWYVNNKIDLKLNTNIKFINHKNKSLSDEEDNLYHYDIHHFDICDESFV